MNLPRITVVTPSFNQADYLEATIRSVLGQNYPDLEYFIIDGGSTDSSIDVIRRHERSVAFWCSEPDQGQSDAIAKGFERASGEILCWLNSDDLFLPGALLAVGRYFRRHPEAEALSGGAYWIDPSGRPMRRGAPVFTLGVRATYDYLRHYDIDGLFQQATFWTRAAYEAVGGIDRTLHYVMDWDLYIRLAKRRRFDVLGRFLGGFRYHAGSKTARWREIYEREREIVLSRYGNRALPPHVRSLRYWRYRIPSLARKAILWGGRTFGFIDLKPVMIEPFARPREN
ncbi:MAG: glycosyltransferase [Planctomycetes bacterium]|nr:glycosyltransferase [Planctomycetota bacterium]